MIINDLTNVAPLILIAEDDLDTQDLLKELLELENYQALIASNGYEALEKITQYKPALVILDLKMPRLDGERVIEVIRQIPLADQPEILLVSASRDVLTVANSYGIKACLQKPYNLDDLLNLVRRYFHPIEQAV